MIRFGWTLVRLGVMAAALALLASSLQAAPRQPAPRSNERYAAELYRGLLGRRPTGSELDRTISELRSAPYRIAALNGVLDSKEFAERVEDDAFLTGLFLQIHGRAPLAHEMLIGQHFLGEGVPRSEIFGSVLHAGLAPQVMTPDLAERYDDELLRFDRTELTRARREARRFKGLDKSTMRTQLLTEAAEVGGAEPGVLHRRCTPSDDQDPVFNVYYGYLHAHTAISLDALLEGSPGPFAAYDYAKNVAGLDFLGLSDHAEFISPWPWYDEWRILQFASDLFNSPGEFVALRGFEYSNPLYGHINTFGTGSFTSTWTQLTLDQFYDWLSGQPHAASTFNHPGEYDFLNLEFLHFQHFPSVHEQLAGIELLTHNDDYDKYSVGYVAEDGLGHMDEAIRSGWRIASVSAQDNHSGGWGTTDDFRTGVLALGLTRDDILDAVRRRRFFSTQDKNLSLSFRSDDQEMGACLAPGTKSFTVTSDDADGESLGTIEFYADGALVETRVVVDAGPWQFDVANALAGSYYYVLLTQEDGDQAMSAPIWVEATD